MKAAAVALIGLLLAGCAGGKSRDFERYYDPQGMFSADLPLGNEVTVSSPQPPPANGPGFLAGVVSQPPAPSPTPASGSNLVGGNLTQQAPRDQTIYEVFVVSTDTLSEVSDMALYFLTSDPAVDVKLDQDASVGGMKGRLVVVDITRSGSTTASLAAAFTLGDDGRGYIVAAVFPPGQWSQERSDFLKVLESFRPDVPPAIGTVPLTGGSA